MPQHTHTPARRCPDCDGHATAAITTGTRRTNGTLPTITVHCRTCTGTGTIPAPRTALTLLGR